MDFYFFNFLKCICFSFVLMSCTFSSSKPKVVVKFACMGKFLWPFRLATYYYYTVSQKNVLLCRALTKQSETFFWDTV